VKYLKVLLHPFGDTEKRHEKPVMIDSNLSKIQTGYLQNVSPVLP
jgi:hypothetical protein